MSSHCHDLLVGVLSVDLGFEAVHGVFMILLENVFPQWCRDSYSGGQELRG